MLFIFIDGVKLTRFLFDVLALNKILSNDSPLAIASKTKVEGPPPLELVASFVLNTFIFKFSKNGWKYDESSPFQLVNLIPLLIVPFACFTISEAGIPI